MVRGQLGTPLLGTGKALEIRHLGAQMPGSKRVPRCWQNSGGNNNKTDVFGSERQVYSVKRCTVCVGAGGVDKKCVWGLACCKATLHPHPADCPCRLGCPSGPGPPTCALLTFGVQPPG